MPVPSFSDAQLEKIAHTLAEGVSHRELSDLFQQCAIEEQGGAPRWERILLALRVRQVQDRCGNNAAAFLQAAMAPVRFLDKEEAFTSIQGKLNHILVFSGLRLKEDGKLTQAETATTLSEAQAKTGRLRKALRDRQVHPDVLTFCKPELLEENYFHAVFEATKSVAEKIRNKTGLSGDGTLLADAAFSTKNPYLALNTLQTEPERSDQTGFGNLLKGIFGTFRNVTAHAPKQKWAINEQDALDLLTMVSYAHRRLDQARVVQRSI